MITWNIENDDSDSLCGGETEREKLQSSLVMRTEECMLTSFHGSKQKKALIAKWHPWSDKEASTYHVKYLLTDSYLT
jgi:hypothetical protein